MVSLKDAGPITPQGHLLVTISNITSSTTKGDRILKETKGGLHLLSELHHDEELVESLRCEARAFSAAVAPAAFVFGECSAQAGVGAAAGAAVVGRIRKVAPPAGVPALPWIQEGRLLLLCVTVKGLPRHFTDRGETNVYFFLVYAYY